jgi:hypothetical protein
MDECLGSLATGDQSTSAGFEGGSMGRERTRTCSLTRNTGRAEEIETYKEDWQSVVEVMGWSLSIKTTAQ